VESRLRSDQQPQLDRGHGDDASGLPCAPGLRDDYQKLLVAVENARGVERGSLAQRWRDRAPAYTSARPARLASP